MIVLSIFAVYGAYALLREIAMLFSRKSRVVVAVRISGKMDSEQRSNAIITAENYIHYNSFLERVPIIISEDLSAKELKKYGFKVYGPLTEEEWLNKRMI